jgi:hypothetical protein
MKAAEREASISERMEAGDPPCGEAQADGVPCEEPDRDCEDCDQAKGFPEKETAEE